MSGTFIDNQGNEVLVGGAADNHFKANLNFDNINDTAKNIANWSSNVSNCITYIPQNIKLELNNGTLTLKAGSKPYNGNGLITTTDVDMSFSTANVNDTVFLIYIPSTNSLGTAFMTGESVSSLPASATSYKLYYNTTDKKCYIDNGMWSETSFPLAIVTSTTIQIASIDQIFNGFGEIGNTKFILPHLKGLLSNGKNTDGTYINIPFEVQNVITRTFETTRTGQYTLGTNGSSINISTKGFVLKEDGFVYDLYNDTKIQTCVFGQCYLTSGKISNSQDKQVFHALDYNDTSYISSQSCPARTYPLTTLASGQQYVMPVNGIFFVGMNRNSATWSLSIATDKLAVKGTTSTNNNTNTVVANIRAAKGEVITVAYSSASSDVTIRAVADKGEI